MDIPMLNIQLLQQLMVNGLVVGSLYGVVAMSFVLVYKASKVVNFAQGEFVLVGAWVCWWLLVHARLPLAAAFPLTLAFMAAFGVLLQRLVLRRMVGEPVIAVIMLTIGLSMVLQALMKWLFGTSAQPFPALFDMPDIRLLGLQVRTIYLLALVASLTTLCGFAAFFRYSRLGLAMRATAYDQQLAQAMGIPVRRVFAWAWAISAMVSALAGVVVGVVNGASPALSSFGIKVFPAVILGGLDAVAGAVAGGLLIGLLENLAHMVDSQWLHAGNLVEIAPFYVLVAILMLRPQGLFGSRDVERV